MSEKQKAKQGRLPANINIESKPAPGNAFTVIDTDNKKILMRIAIGCRRDTNPEKDGAMQALWEEAGGKDQLQLSRYEAVAEPYFLAKLGRKGDFVPITFLCGPGYKKCMGFEGMPTDSNIKKALKDKKLLRYEWTGQEYLDAVAAGEQVFELRDGVAVETNLTVEKAKEMIKAKADRDKAREKLKAEQAKEKAAEAKETKAKPKKKTAAKKKTSTKKKKAAKKKATAKEAKESGAVKRPRAKQKTWYQVVDGKINRKRVVNQPEGFYPTEKEAKLNRVVTEPVAADAAE